MSDHAKPASPSPPGTSSVEAKPNSKSELEAHPKASGASSVEAQPASEPKPTSGPGNEARSNLKAKPASQNSPDDLGSLQQMVETLLDENDELREMIERPLRSPVIVAGIAALCIGALIFMRRNRR